MFCSIGYAPLNIAYWDVIFLHRVDHAPTNKRKARLFIFLDLFEGYDRYNDPKKYKNGHNLSGKTKTKTKTKTKKACFPFVRTCGSNMRFNFWIETRKIERGSSQKNPHFS